MSRYQRFSLYYTPPPGRFADFGAAWLGWDSALGMPVAHPDIAGLPAPVSDLTQTPRRYGLHATLMAPFHLAGAHGADDLHRALASFCACTPAPPIGRLQLTQMGRFLALAPQQQPAALGTCAAALVQQFDQFRAPLTPADLARRSHAGLSPAQRENLARWGYAHVMAQFRFHITLTGKLPKPQIAEARNALTRALPSAPQSLDAITLMGEDESGQFHQIARCPLQSP